MEHFDKSRQDTSGMSFPDKQYFYINSEEGLSAPFTDTISGQILHVKFQKFPREYLGSSVAAWREGAMPPATTLQPLPLAPMV